MTDDAGGDVHDGEPVFRRGDASDAPAVLRVIEAAFPRWPPFEINVPTIDHLRWKMTPAGLPGNLHGIVELDGEIVAVQVRWQSRVHVRGIEHPCEYSADLSVLPSAQGRGLGNLLRDSEAERQRREPSVGFDTIGTNERAVQMYSARGGEAPVPRRLGPGAHGSCIPRGAPSGRRSTSRRCLSHGRHPARPRPAEQRHPHERRRGGLGLR